MSDIWGVEFRRANLVSSYPFADGSSLTTTDGLTLGSDAILDAELGLPGPPDRVALTSIATTVDSATLAFGWGDDPAAARATFPLATIPAALDVVDAAGVVLGTLVVDPDALASLQAWPEGTHAFPDGAADLVASALTPAPAAGVSGLVGPEGVVLAGEAWLVGWAGVTLEADAGSGTIGVHAVGDPLGARAACVDAGGEFEPPRPIRTINGVGPDAAGRFLLAAAGMARGSTILRVEPAAPDAILIGLSTSS